MQPYIHRISGFLLALLLTSAAGSFSALAEETSTASASDAFRFRVFLDDQEIGYHHFYLDGTGDARQVRSVADFEYRLLFVKLYDYEHENLETWSGDCLQSVQSRTDANGELHRVVGRRESEAGAPRFRVAGSAGEATLPGCVMSFAYWNPAFLEQPRLLNTQDGEFLDVQVAPPVAESLEVRGEPREAWRYRLAAGELRLDLWYSADREWLALESEVRGGRKLRYELL